MSKITEFINKQKSRSDIEKDIHNPFRRVVRHTIFKNKYGNMMDYHVSACSYYCNQPMINIDQVVAESREKMKQHLEERDKNLEEKEAKKAAKKAKKDLTDEVVKIIEEDTEALQNIVDELHEINKEEESSKEDQNVDNEADAVTEDLINNNPNITKGEDGLYHFTPVFFHDEDPKKDEKVEAVKEEPKAETEESVKEETSNVKPKKEPKVPQDRKKPAAKKSTKK